MKSSCTVFDARRRLRIACALLALAAQFLPGGVALAQYGRPPQSSMPQGGTPDALKAVRIDQKLGAQVPLGATFRDEAGREVRLGDYFREGKPVVLSLVYYECPMLCNQILNGMVGALEAVTLKPGKDFRVVSVSFDARETPELAAKKKETYLRRYRRNGQEGEWHFLTGGQQSVDEVAQAVGFNYAWDERSKQFAHGSAIMVATPEGKLSHYFYGIEYPPKDLRLALVEASSNRIGNPVDQLLLYCYHYDPTTGKYGPVIMNIMRVAGVLTVFAVVALLLLLRRRQRRRDGDGDGGGDGRRWDEGINVGGAS